jgi:splicing factor 1
LLFSARVGFAEDQPPVSTTIRLQIPGKSALFAKRNQIQYPNIHSHKMWLLQEQKLQLRVPIPIKEYPDYNFIGLIIGPRGMTQKQMERDTGCKVTENTFLKSSFLQLFTYFLFYPSPQIAIRGRGSVKDGKSTSGMSFEEPLHVLITAPNADSLKRAEQMVRKLVTPMEEAKNDHKRAQLRKLAEINGTLRDGLNDDIMGDQSGQRAPDRTVCRNCGVTTHPTYDCVSHFV